MTISKTSCVAAALIVACACGSSSPVLTDARIATADAAHADAVGPVDATPTGAVSVHAFASGAPLVGVNVDYQAADHTHLSTQLTDSNGNATFNVAADSTVSLLPQFPLVDNNQTIISVEGANPGDMLQFVFADNTARSTSVAFPLDEAASSYVVWASCGTGSNSSGTSSPITTDITGCGATADFMVTEFDQNNQLLGSLLALNVDTTQPATLSGNYASLRTVSTTFSNVPASITSLAVDITAVTANGPLFEIQNVVDVTLPSGPTLSLPNNDGLVYRVITTAQQTDASVVQSIIESVQPSNDYSLDVGASLLPWPSNIHVDVTNNELAWDETPTAAAVDFVVTKTIVAHADNSVISWAIEAPYTGKSVAFPIFPGADEQGNLQTTDTVQGAALFYGSVTGGYDAVRSNVIGVFQKQAFSALPIGQRAVVVGNYGKQ